MYEAFFDLEERPFTAGPLAGRYYAAAAIENARKTLSRCIERAEGAGLLIGPTGTGKSLLLEVLAAEFGNRFAVANLASGRICTRRALLQGILYELGLSYRGMEDGELRLSLLDFLSSGKQVREGLVLLVDEAHTMPLRLIDELRMITNQARAGQPRVRVILAGSPQLEERFASPKLDSFSQRVAARCYLESLDRADTIAYSRAQIMAAGGHSATIFAEDALQAIYRATDGVPRLINQVCDHALMLASAALARPVTGSIVEEAWADLQQLPTPWNSAETRTFASSKVIEFAGLDEEPAVHEEGPEAIPFRATASGFSAGNAEQHLDIIAGHVAELEEEFEPAGSIGPDVEMVFPEFGSLFGDRWQDEEIVIDRYASLDSDVFGQRPMVTSKESRELAALLAPLACTSEPMLASETIVTTRFDAAATSRTVTSNTDEDDSDLIVVEEDVIPAPHMAKRREPLARRQEYRQLFAKLRRG